MDSDSTRQDGYRALRAIRRIVRQIGTHSRRVDSSSGLSLPQVLCMRAVRDADEEEVTVAAIADAMGLSRSTVSVMAEKLVKSGMLNRERSQRDRRRVHLSVTPAGQEQLRSLPMPLQDRFLMRLEAMEAADRENVLSTLEQVVEMMDAESLEAAPMLVPGADLPKTNR